MMCYRDMTFCINPNCTCDPRRRLTREIEAAAERWWGGPGAPLCVADLCKAKPQEDPAEDNKEAEDD